MIRSTHRLVVGLSSMAVTFGLCQVSATAQSTLYALDLRNDALLASATDNFVVASNTVNSALEEKLFAFDFDASGTTLFAVDYDTAAYGTVDLGTGQFFAAGISNLPTGRVRGMTAHPNGTTWYVTTSLASGPGSELWSGNITTGSFQLVGLISNTALVIDIACDVNGALLGYDLVTNRLLSINAANAAPSVLGSSGYVANHAQGMDFDWTSNTLYAALYGMDGLGDFAELSLANGAATLLDSTNRLEGEFKIAVMEPHPNTLQSFCSPASLNGVGRSTQLSGYFGSGLGSDLHLEVTNGTPGQFGIFVVSTAFANPGVSLGNGQLCLTGPLGRFVGPGDINSIGQFDAAGVIQNLVGTATSTGGSGFDVPSMVPSTSTTITISPGTTLAFQFWHRDTPNGFNFSNGVSTTF